MQEFFTLDSVSTSDIFPNFNLFPQLFEHREDSMSVELSTVSEETQSTVTTASSMSAQMQETETSQNNFSEEELVPCGNKTTHIDAHLRRTNHSSLEFQVIKVS